jgi:MFS family permease
VLHFCFVPIFFIVWQKFLQISKLFKFEKWPKLLMGQIPAVNWRPKLLMGQIPAVNPKNLGYFIIEPATLFYALAFGIYFGAFTPGFYWKICWQNFGKNSSIDCNNLGLTIDAETQVQKMTVGAGLVLGVGSFLPGMLISLIFGSISDKIGRKPILLIAIAFSSFQFLSYVWEFTFLGLSVYWLVLTLSFTGLGAVSLTSAQLFSYCILLKSFQFHSQKSKAVWLGSIVGPYESG